MREFPFPFVGSGETRWESADLIVCFADGRVDERRTIVDGIHIDEDAEPEEQDRMRLELLRKVETATAATVRELLALHARSPIAFAVWQHVAPHEHDLDAWHKWSIAQVDKLAERLPVAALALTAEFLRGAAKKRLHAQIRDRLQPRAERGEPVDVALYRQVVGELPAKQRREAIARAHPRIQVALALTDSDLLERLDSERLREADPGDLVTLAERLVTRMIDAKKAARGRLAKLAEAALDAAPDAPTDRRLLLYAFTERFDECLSLLPEPPFTPFASYAFGNALAQATVRGHQRFIAAAIAHARVHGKLLANPVTVANVLGALLAASRFADASALAAIHVEQDHGMTPVLYTNAILAFAYADETGPMAARLASRMEELLEDDGDYFRNDGAAKADWRGSAHAWLGAWYARNGDVESLLRHFACAQALDYQDLAMLEKHPALLHLKHDPRVKPYLATDADAAIAAKTKQIRKNDRDWFAVFSRGLLYHESGDLPRAIADYERTLELNPSYPDVYINMGNIHWTRDKNYAEAVRWYDRALALAENQITARLNRAEAKLYLADPAAALSDAKRAAALQANNPHTHSLAALAHAALGDQAAAREQARRAAVLDHAFTSIDRDDWKQQLQALSAS